MTEDTTSPAERSRLVPFEMTNHDQLAVPGRKEVVLFPEYMVGDNAVYRPSVIEIAKRLEVEGIEVRYAYPNDQRTWLRELSAGEIVVQLVIGVGSGVPLFALGQWLERRRGGQLRVRVTRARKVRGRRAWDATVYDVNGTSEEVRHVLRDLAEEWKDE